MRSFIIMFADRLIEWSLNRWQFDERKTLNTVNDIIGNSFVPVTLLSCLAGYGIVVAIVNTVYYVYGPNVIPPVALMLAILYGGIFGSMFVGIWGTEQAGHYGTLFAKRLLNRQFARTYGGC